MTKFKKEERKEVFKKHSEKILSLSLIDIPAIWSILSQFAIF